MRGVPQATLARLPISRPRRRWPSWAIVVTRRERRWPSARVETLERLHRERREALRKGAEQPELRWLRRY